MIRTIADFEAIWKNESEITAGVLAAVTDASLAQRVTPNDRTLRDMAWHIVATIAEMMGRTGLAIEGLDADAPAPASAEAIRDAYVRVASSLLERLRRTWTDETLTVEDDMYGERWPRGATLLALVVHQTHHRGAMTVLMRQAGLVVPNIYGPNREQSESLGLG
ncbi:MAG: hypothetical protein A2Y78_13610 [Acidobacteria bacterium RBG_13_68_16]|jgi:uncharacterized damage-inducible protein DinB|nr:MAG: hypothetical protein A2Y78_13610 [Acidobacteria bacterium RBG_13_68_16]